LTRGRRVVLIGSTEHDTTINVVGAILSSMRNVSVMVFDGSGLGEHLHLSARFPSTGCDPIRFECKTPHDTLDWREVHSVWNRRWHNPAVLQDVTRTSGLHDFAEENWRRFVNGVWLCSAAKWVNAPPAHTVAANKVLQLREAKEVGFAVPETLITSDPAAAAAFIADYPRGVICKSLGNTFSSPATQTVLLHDGHLAMLKRLGLAPAIFQEYVRGESDIRVTVVGDRVFAGRIHTAKGNDPVDWRTDPDNPWYTHRLPPTIKHRCVELTHRLGLRYGAIDLRMSAEGEYVFFEINPGGQFLFLEVWTGLPIAKALATYLVN
jgi:ribosomal protein S6-L-glutamate ligase RimK-like protein